MTPEWGLPNPNPGQRVLQNQGSRNVPYDGDIQAGVHGRTLATVELGPPPDPPPARLLCQCWCQESEVRVPVSWIRAGVAPCCGRVRCHWLARHYGFEPIDCVPSEAYLGDPPPPERKLVK